MIHSPLMEEVWKVGTWNLLTGFAGGVGVTQLLGSGSNIMAVIWLAVAFIASFFANKQEEKVERMLR